MQNVFRKFGFVSKIKKRIVVLVDGHNFDDISILEQVIFLYPHLCPCINGIEKSLADIGMYLVCQIMRRRSFPHQERIGKHLAFLVAEMVLIFNRVDNDHVEQVKLKRLVLLGVHRFARQVVYLHAARRIGDHAPVYGETVPRPRVHYVEGSAFSRW